MRHETRTPDGCRNDVVATGQRIEAVAEGWYDAGEALTADGDVCLARDDFDGACRRYLVAAWCFARAAASAGIETSDPYRASYRYAVRAASPLLPVDPSAGSHSSSSVAGSP